MPDSAAKKILDWANKDSINMARVEAGSVSKVKAFLSGLESDLVKILADNKDLAPGKKAKLETILAASQDAIQQTYDGISSEVGKDLKGVAAAQSKGVGKMINQAIGVDVLGSVLTENQLSQLVKETFVHGHPAHDWWQAQSDGFKQKFSAAVNTGYALGEDIDAITRRIRGTKANGFTDGVMQTSRREAEALARTAVQTISNSAKMASYEEMSDTIKGIEWVATLDTRTTPICRALDGKKWTFPGLKPVGHDKKFPGPIAHWNCRSTQVPVLYTWEELSGKPIKALDGDTYAERVKEKLKKKGMSDEQIAKVEVNAKASMNGQVPDSMTHDKWLQSLPNKQTREILGPGRFKLWSEGKLTVSDLTDQNNRPLSIAQLNAAIENGGFAVETEGANFAPFDLSKAKAPAQKAAQDLQKVAAQKIADVMADPKAKGNSILASNLSKVQANEPSLSPAETLAKAEELTAAKIAANTKSSILSKAKKNMVDGNPPTAGQKAVIDELGEDEKAAFLEAVADAKTAKQAVELQKQASDKLIGWGTNPVKQKAIDQAIASGADPSNPMQVLAAAEDELGKLVAADTAGNTLAAAKKAMKSLTGMDSPTAESVNAWLKQQGVDPAEFHAQFEALTKEKAEQAVKSSVLSKAKKKLAAGEEPTPAQKTLIDSLTPEEKAVFDEQVADVTAKQQAEQAKKAAEKAAQDAADKAAAAAQAKTAAESSKLAQQAAQQASTAQSNLPHPDDLKIVGSLGGSTGAKLAEDSAGNRYVVKRGATPDHVRSEQQADDLYRALGLAVPDGAVFETASGPVKVSRFLEGSKPLASLTGKAKDDAFAQLREGFQVDALLGNWDVAGTGLDNVLVTPDGKVWRIDNGGALKYRAQGGLKSADAWNRYPDELWTMRDKANISGPIYGSMDIFQIAKQIEGQEWKGLADVALDPVTRDILDGRVAEMRHLARRSLDFGNDGYLAAHTDGVAKATLDVRKAGVSSSMPAKLTVQGSYHLIDDNGRAFGNLRTASTLTGAPMVPKVQGDLYSDDILIASKALASCALNKKDVASGSAPGKMATVKAHIPALKKLATTGTPDQVKMAANYLTQIDELVAIEKAGGIPAQAPSMFEAAKPSAAATPTTQNAKSVVKQWEAMMAAEGINVQPIRDWMASQSGNSWTPQTQALKVAFANGMQDPETSFYWEGNGAYSTSWQKAQQHYKTAVQAAGGEAKLQRLVQSWHAVTQEILSEIDAPWIDRDRRAVLLYRTVSQQEIDGSIEKPDAKGVFTPLRGTTESHSIYKKTSVYGNILTVQAVPFSRVLATYWTEKPGQSGGSGFLSDSEAEFAANTSGIKALKKANFTAPGFDDQSKDATTWGVPLDHLRTK